MAIICEAVSNPKAANRDGPILPSVVYEKERRWGHRKNVHMMIKGVRKAQLPDSHQTEGKNGGKLEHLSAIARVFRGWLEAAASTGT